jgi:hypothetical protein
MADDVRNTQTGVETAFDAGDTEARVSQVGLDESTIQIATLRHSQFGVEDNYDVPGDIFITQYGVEFLITMPPTSTGEKCDAYFVGF